MEPENIRSENDQEAWESKSAKMIMEPEKVIVHAWEYQDLKNSNTWGSGEAEDRR